MRPKLKSLELHGYKTFAGRSLFEFPGNVTAIVGPNGSGKSNIADAIRWVLGEQSFSLLRGKKTEDMIFLGSDQRPKAGMASATITFDNDEGWLPVDFSEVAVSRRAYRDGSNEYLLNKQRVRLRDTNELLAQSGLAERTYTIIGQGLVDAALSLRPEERRKFFEEAAGITLYRSRREESLNRLDTTRRNLERVTDILGELEPRLRSLERQAKRVEEYDRVKDDLQSMLKDWHGYHWQNHQKELLRNREILKNQEEKVIAAREKRGEIETRVDEARLRLQELREQLNGWHMATSDHHRQREKISREIAVLEERVKAHQNQNFSLANDLQKAEELDLSYRERLVFLQTERNKVDEDLLLCREELTAIEKTFNTRKEERADLEISLSRVRKQLVEFETRQVQSKAHQNELQNRTHGFIESQHSLQRKIEENRSAVEGAQKESSAIHAEQLKIKEKLSVLNQELVKVTDELSALDDGTKKSSLEVNKLEADYARTTAQLEVLLQAERAFSGLGEGAKSLLSAASKGTLPKELKTLSGFLEVPFEYEAAVSAALGDQLDAVLYDSGVDVEALLMFLEREGSGRAMLMPFSIKDARRKIVTASNSDVLGLLPELIQIDSQAKELVDILLGRVIVVKDRSTARQLMKTIPEGAKVVTLKGEIFNSNGIIIAGKENNASLISRPRQKKDLEELVKTAQLKLNQARNALEKIRSREQELIHEKREFEKKIQEVQSNLRQVDGAFLAKERNLASLQQQLEWQNSQIEVLAGQINSAEVDIKKTQEGVDETQTTIEKLDGNVREISEKLRSLPIDEIQNQLVHWNTTLAVSERALLEAENRVKEFEQTISQNLSLAEQLKTRIQQQETTSGEVFAAITAAKMEEEKINIAINEYSALIDPAETELQKLDSEYSGLQHEYSQLQQLEGNADRVFSQAQLEYSRSREALENLRRRIEEDFGLVYLEYNEDVSGPTPLPLEGIGTLVLLTELPKGLEESINRQRALLRRMGAINPEARNEYLEVKERHDFLTNQMNDLQKADKDLRQIVSELDDLMSKLFLKTFNAVAVEFKEMFTRLFGGGSARLVMTQGDNLTETGIDIEARLPGRREQGLSLLSGGERSLTAVALIFSLLRVAPTPFCILDEVDAMLDEANVGRFTELLRDLSKETQFIVITHNRNTVQVADVIYGVTMGRDSSSQVISLRLDEVSEEMVR